MECNSIYTTIIYFTNDPLFDVKKPFACVFSIEDMPGAQASDYIFEKRRIFVRDIRGQPLHNLNKFEFTFIEAETAFKPENFEFYNFVRERYFKELEQLILRLLPQYSKVIYMDHNVCLLPICLRK